MIITHVTIDRLMLCSTSHAYNAPGHTGQDFLCARPVIIRPTSSRAITASEQNAARRISHTNVLSAIVNDYGKSGFPNRLKSAKFELESPLGA